MSNYIDKLTTRNMTNKSN